MRGAWGIALAILVGAACKKDPPVATPADSGTSAPSSSKDASGEAGARSADESPADAGEAKVPLTVEEKRSLTTYAEAMAEGRKATRAKRYADAEEAFGKALVARPDDARARSERGYARLLDGALDKADEDFRVALGRGVDAKLAGQLFFNVGLLREKKNEAESARAAFAISNALSPTAAAKNKLAGRSACTADIQIGGDDRLEHASSFEDLHAKIAPAEDLGSPKASVCVRTHTAMGTPDETDLCSGPPPWMLTHHHLHFTEDQYFVVPQKADKKGSNGLLFFSSRIGAWPAHCTNLPFPSAEMAGEFLHVKETFDGSMAALDETKAAANDWDMPCMDVLGYESHAFYDTGSGRRVLRIYLPKNVPVPAVAVTGAKVVLTGAGCDRTLDLASLRR